MMNIYALDGFRVRCYTLDAGYDYDKEIANRYLDINDEYTVDYTEVDGYRTEVYLKEFEGIPFNSVFFEDIDKQSDEDDMEHPDYHRYN
jgi:hypothetical protein